MRNTMQINYWTIGGFDGKKPVEQALEEAKEMGFEGVELCFGAGELVPGVTKMQCHVIKHAARELDMKIESLASGAYWTQSLASPGKKMRERACEFTKEYLNVASWLGAKVVLVIPGAVAVPWDKSQPVVPYADVWRYAAESIRKVLPAAKRAGVSIGIENVWNWFLADPVAMRVFVDQFDSPQVGVYFDVANCAINGFPEHWIQILGHRIKAVHFKNFSREDCGGVLHGFGDDMTRGDVDFKSVTRALNSIGYRGPITAEMIPFSRLPNLVLPDMKMARDTARKMGRILGK